MPGEGIADDLTGALAGMSTLPGPSCERCWLPLDGAGLVVVLPLLETALAALLMVFLMEDAIVPGWSGHAPDSRGGRDRWLEVHDDRQLV